MKKFLAGVFLFLSLSPSAHAAETLTLTLRDALAIALRNNPTLKTESFNRDIASSDVMIQKGEFDPLLGTELLQSFTKVQTPNVLVGSEERTVDFNAFLKGKAVTGTAYELSWGNERFKGNSQFLEINPFYRSDLNLAISQPLLKGFGVDVQRAKVKASENSFEISKINYERVSEEIVLRTIDAYWNVVSSRSNLEVVELSLSLAQKIFDEVRAKIDAGLLAPVEIYQAEAEIAVREQGLLTYRNALFDSIDALRGVLDLEDWSADIVIADAPPELERLPDMEGTLVRALEARKDYRSAVVEKQRREVLFAYFRNQRLPEVNLVGSAGLNGTEGEYEDALDNLGSGEYYSWSMGISLVLPLWNDLGQGNYRRAKYELEQTEQRLRELENSIRVEIRQKLRAVDLAMKRIYSTQKTAEASRKRYEAEEGRFKVGLTTLNDVITFQREYLRALADHKVSRVAYAIALADYHRSQGTLLESFGLVVQ